MAISEAFAVSETVTQATEWSLTTDTAGPDLNTDDGVYQLFLDLNTLVDGDTIRIRFYEKVQAADTQRAFFTQDISNAQGAVDNWVSPSFVLLHGWDITAQMVTATSRAITSSVRKIA
jgi:hypothetical protein